jgi:hypothetical protein
MTDWSSAALPEPATGTFNEVPAPNRRGFEPDTGPPIMSKRATSSGWTSAFQLVLTATELAALKTLFETTCLDGTLPFTMAHPQTGTTYSWSWALESPLSIAHLTTGVGGKVYRASVNLYRRP